jgi:hypothetical protein
LGFGLHPNLWQRKSSPIICDFIQFAIDKFF